MAKQKSLEQLRAEKEQVEKRLAQEQHDGQPERPNESNPQS